MLPKLALALLVAALAVPAGSFALTTQPQVGPDEIPDQVLLGFHDGIPADLGAWLQARGGVEVLRDDVLHFVVVKFPDAAAAQRALDAAKSLDSLRYAQRDGVVRVLLTPNDPLYGNQWGYPAIFAEQAWDVTLGTHAATVAVLDTGIKGNHPDLVANLCGPHASFIPGEVALVDGYGHGTHVAGTVAAATNNGIGVAGTSQACLMDVKVLSRFGGGSWGGVAAGIRWAADNGADIISMSLGGGNPGQIMVDAVKYAYNTKGVLVIAAAGNSGCGLGSGLVPNVLNTNQGSVIWPAIYDEVVAVAALAPPDGLTTAGFSSCGADVEVAAPGENVLSALPPCTEAILCSSTLYGSLSGTSMAAPHVSGVAALVLSQDPGISAVALRCLLDLTADDYLDSGNFPIPGRDFQGGWGKVNALRALQTDTALRTAGAMDAFEDGCLAAAKQIMY